MEALTVRQYGNKFRTIKLMMRQYGNEFRIIKLTSTNLLVRRDKF